MSYTLPFKNPPITEALLDIRVKKSADISLETLLSFQDRVKDTFPIKQERFSWQGGVQFKKDSTPEFLPATTGIDGYLFKSENGLKIAQARRDGFTFNQLRPYPNWEVFRNEAKVLWEHYLQVANPDTVERLALRYINRIDIPLPFKDFKEYILTYPEIAKGIPQGLSTYFIRLVVPKEEISAFAIITQTFKPLKPDEKILSLIFDIDVSRGISLSVLSDDIWKIMEDLRNFKNEIFMNSTTEKAKELFK